MPRRNLVATAVAAVAAVAVAAPALAEETTYEQHEFESSPRKSEGTPERITLEVPTGWERQDLSRTTVGFDNVTVRPQSIIAYLHPVADTVRETRAEVKMFREMSDRYYREYFFQVNDEDKKIRVRWVYAYRDAQTDDTWSYTSVYLLRDDRLVVDGRLVDKDELKEIRKHVVTSYTFQEE